MKIKTMHIGCEYLTAGKEYETTKNTEKGAYILDDDDCEIFVYLPESFHIGGEAWEVIK